MRRITYRMLMALIIVTSVKAQSGGIPEKDKAVNQAVLEGEKSYTLGPDSMKQPGVPEGKIRKYTLADCTVYPGNSHDYWVYVPQQYDPNKPAGLMVFTDGEAYLNEFKVPTVLDNLIAKGQLPEIIAVFVNPGPHGTGYPIKGGTDNRSVEYDSITDDYSRFLLEDLLPKIETGLNISHDPSRRGIAGLSSGGNCAFAVAWHRPDSFGLVLSWVGSFTAMRGGNVWPAIIRQSKGKPIRVFLQDGANDLNTIFGNWPLANKEMASALAYRDYDYKFVFGEGGHSGKQGAAILPEALRWLWRK
jgi:enterochelin esterase-like enzyme